MRIKIPVLLLGMFIAITSANAQKISISPADFIEATYNENDMADDYIFVRNHAGAPMDLSFQTLKNTMSANGWDVLLCTNKDCFTYVPSSGSLGVIASGDSGYFDLRVSFVGKVGTGELKLRVYEKGNPSNADTISVIYHAGNTDGIFAITTNNLLPLSQNFPNPFNQLTTAHYNLPGTKGTLIITDLAGKVIKTIVLNQASGTVAIDNEFTNGMYFYCLKNESGSVIATREMVVY